MKLTIKNIERINEIDNKYAPNVVTCREYDDRYEIAMNYQMFNWYVLLYRNSGRVDDEYRMTVQFPGRLEVEETILHRNELRSSGLTLAIIQKQMENILKRIGIC